MNDRSFAPAHDDTSNDLLFDSRVGIRENSAEVLTVTIYTVTQLSRALEKVNPQLKFGEKVESTL